MKLETIKLADIVPYDNNPRKNDDAVQAVADSIKECSYITPIIIDENKVIIAGHTRYKALQLLGIQEAPCLICEGFSDEQKRKYRFLDNKTGEKATWDFLKLEIELEELNIDKYEFFGIEDENIPVESERSLIGSTEYGVEVFGDEEFKYQCPKCGFRFN